MRFEHLASKTGFAKGQGETMFEMLSFATGKTLFVRLNRRSYPVNKMSQKLLTEQQFFGWSSEGCSCYLI
jgi:hypothetical protein